jgi:hypothetical protein
MIQILMLVGIGLYLYWRQKRIEARNPKPPADPDGFPGHVLEPVLPSDKRSSADKHAATVLFNNTLQLYQEVFASDPKEPDEVKRLVDSDMLAASGRGDFDVPLPISPPSAPNPQIDARIRALLTQHMPVEAIILTQRTYGGDYATAKAALIRIKSLPA